MVYGFSLVSILFLSSQSKIYIIYIFLLVSEASPQGEDGRKLAIAEHGHICLSVSICHIFNAVNIEVRRFYKLDMKGNCLGDIKKIHHGWIY